MVMILVLALASPLWGADTRDGRDWQPRVDWQSPEDLRRARARTGVR